MKTFNLQSPVPKRSASILDVGGTSATWRGTGLEKQVTLLNLTSPKDKDIDLGFKAVKGNALEMGMFSDNEFDIVFSNSVIEHVGSLENQKRFAREVRRVGKSYWVQTPNKMFPVEPHFLFPFFQFMPGKLQKSVALKWKYSHMKRWARDDQHLLKEFSLIRLLSCREFKTLFEDGHLYKEKAFGLTKSFVAYKNAMKDSGGNILIS